MWIHIHLIAYQHQQLIVIYGNVTYNLPVLYKTFFFQIYLDKNHCDSQPDYNDLSFDYKIKCFLFIFTVVNRGHVMCVRFLSSIGH